jgi:hypothetical protein
MGLSVVAVVPVSASKRAKVAGQSGQSGRDDEDEQSGDSSGEDDSSGGSSSGDDSGDSSGEDEEYSRIKGYDKDCDMSYSAYFEFRIRVVQAALGREYGEYMRAASYGVMIGIGPDKMRDILKLTGAGKSKKAPSGDPKPTKEFSNLSLTAMRGFKAFKDHSDCDGAYTHAECEGLLEALTAIEPTYKRMKFDDGYNKMFDSFKRVFAIAVAEPEGYVVYT